MHRYGVLQRDLGERRGGSETDANQKQDDFEAQRRHIFRRQRKRNNGTDADICLTKDTNKKHPEYGTAGKNLGTATYPEEEWKRGGGAMWGWYSYDPELKLVYASSGNPGLWSPQYRCGANPVSKEACNSGKWDNKFSMSIFARRVDTGEVVWVYQMTPFDQWDYDGINENMLEDLTVDGKPHKVLMHFDRNGFAYMLDRTDGTLLRANKYVTVNWAEKVDMKTGNRQAQSGFEIVAEPAEIGRQQHSYRRPGTGEHRISRAERCPRPTVEVEHQRPFIDLHPIGPGGVETAQHFLINRQKPG